MIYYKFFNPEPIYYFCEIEYIHKTEMFKDITGYEGIYQVSDLGRIKSLSRTIYMKGKYPYLSKDKILKPSTVTKGYLAVGLTNNIKTTTKKIHTLVGMTFLNFIFNIKDNLVIDHINEIKKDNRLINIQIITTRQNISKSRTGKYSKFTGVGWHVKNKKWISRINIKGKEVNLGSFLTEEDAYNAYQEKLKAII